jgi:hypothetical protein
MGQLVSFGPAQRRSLRQRPGLAEAEGEPDVIDDDFGAMAGLEDHWARLPADGPRRPGRSSGIRVPHFVRSFWVGAQGA